MSYCIVKHNFLIAKKIIYDKCSFNYTYPKLEEENIKYGANTFNLNNLFVKARTAKITPTKTGQFVTLWKRSKKGNTEPHDVLDPFDIFVINLQKDNLFGQFIFPKSALCKYGIISNGENKGKRGIRVYPPWDKTTSIQAKKTQKWQLNYFLEIYNNGETDLKKAKILYSGEVKLF